MNPQASSPEDYSQYEVKPLVDDFNKYEVKPTEESTAAYIARGATRVASRIGEGIIGLPGDIRELAGTGVIKAAEGITGEEQPWLRKKLVEGRRAPLSHELREKTAELSGGYTEPQTPGEEKSDEFLTDLAMLALPVKGRIPFVRAIGTDVAGHLVKEGMEKFGAGKNAQEWGKIGTFFLAGLITPGKTAKTFADNLYKERDVLLPAGADVDATLLRQGLEKLKATAEKGIVGAKERAVINPIDQLLQKTAGGRVEVDVLTSSKRKVNELIEELVSEKAIKRKDARQLFKPLGREIEKTIELYGKQSNPAFLKMHKDANEAFGAIAESRKVSDMVGGMLKGSHLKTPVGTLFTGGGAAALGSALYHAPHLAGPILAGASSGYAAVKTFELLRRIEKSPVLRKYYLGVIKNSLSGNSAATLKNLHNLDKAMEHDLRVSPDSTEHDTKK